MAYEFKLGEKVIVFRNEPGEIAGEIVGTATVHRSGKIVNLFMVDIGEPRYLEGRLGTVSLLSVHPDNLYPL